MIFTRFTSICLLAFGLLLSPVQAGDKLWSVVVIASNSPRPKATPQELERIAPRLKRVFGYNQFQTLGTSTVEIEDLGESSLEPTENFLLKVKARRSSAKEARGGYLLNLELFQDERRLVETWAILAPNSPFVIRGPMHARGQILIVLQVQPGKESR